MSLALEMCFGIPLSLGYLISALVVIPLVTHRHNIHQQIPALDPALLGRAAYPAICLYRRIGLLLHR